MNIFDDIAIFLPKYLSDDSSTALREELKKFPTDGTKDTIYTSKLNQEEILFQGDGIAAIKTVDLIKEKFKTAPAILLSNTCDMDTKNSRLFGSQVCYAPIIDLEKYLKGLSRFLLKKETDNNKSLSKDQIEEKVSQVIHNHLNDLKMQRITQMLFLPKGGNLANDSIVFLDRIFNIETNHINRRSLKSDRLFTLSDYGLYLFLLKLSIHFTRIQEKVDRFKGIVL